MSRVHIGNALIIVYLSSLCHGYSLGVSSPLSNCLHYVMGTRWVVLTIFLFPPLYHGFLLGVTRQLSICLQYVTGTHWECLRPLSNCLHYVMETRWGVSSMVYLYLLSHRYSLGVF